MSANDLTTAGINRGLRIALKSVEASIATYDHDPADSDFQRGHLAALKEVREEIEREITKRGGGH